MEKITKDLVDYYAKKLLIGLTAEENELVLKEFDIITEQMELITKIPGIKEVEPMVHTLDDFEVCLREDTSGSDSIALEDALKNCDCYEDREIKVPKVVGE